MKTIEEQIWDYIDGNGNAGQRLEMKKKIAADEAYGSVYRELIIVQQHLGLMDLDEPSMSFGRNVMDLVNQEVPPVALQTKIDKRIISGIAAFFILGIIAIFIFAISQSHFTTSKINISITFSRYLTPAFIKTFLFIDIIIGFLYADSLFRRKWMS